MVCAAASIYRYTHVQDVTWCSMWQLRFVIKWRNKYVLFMQYSSNSNIISNFRTGLMSLWIIDLLCRAVILCTNWSASWSTVISWICMFASVLSTIRTSETGESNNMKRPEGIRVQYQRLYQNIKALGNWKKSAMDWRWHKLLSRLRKSICCSGRATSSQFEVTVIHEFSACTALLLFKLSI